MIWHFSVICSMCLVGGCVCVRFPSSFFRLGGEWVTCINIIYNVQLLTEVWFGYWALIFTVDSFPHSTGCRHYRVPETVRSTDAGTEQPHFQSLKYQVHHSRNKVYESVKLDLPRVLWNAGEEVEPHWPYSQSHVWGNAEVSEMQCPQSKSRSHSFPLGYNDLTPVTRLCRTESPAKLDPLVCPTWPVFAVTDTHLHRVFQSLVCSPFILFTFNAFSVSWILLIETTSSTLFKADL